MTNQFYINILREKNTLRGGIFIKFSARLIPGESSWVSVLAIETVYYTIGLFSASAYITGLVDKIEEATVIIRIANCRFAIGREPIKKAGLNWPTFFCATVIFSSL